MLMFIRSLWMCFGYKMPYFIALSLSLSNKIKNIIWRSCCRLNKLQQISLLHFKRKLILGECCLDWPGLFWLCLKIMTAGGCKNLWLHWLYCTALLSTRSSGLQSAVCRAQASQHIDKVDVFMILTWYWMNNFLEDLRDYMTVLEVMLGLDRP